MDRSCLSCQARLVSLGLFVAALVLGAGCQSARPLVLPVSGSEGAAGERLWDDLDLYLIDPAGRRPAVRVTHTPELMETDPDLNPGRDRLVYVVREARRDGRPLLEGEGVGTGAELYVTGLDGQEHRVLYRSDSMCFTPVWSHDGKRIAFAELNSEGRLEVKIIDADGSGLRTLGYGCSPSWRKDDGAIFYASRDRVQAHEGTLQVRVLSTGVTHDIGLPGTGHASLRSGVSVAYSSTPYSRRNESVWLLDANGGRRRLTDPGRTEHDLEPVFFGGGGDVVFTRYDEASGVYRLMTVHRNTQDRAATPAGQPTLHCFTRGGLWVAQRYPR